MRRCLAAILPLVVSAAAADSWPELDRPAGGLEVFDDSAYEFLLPDTQPVIRSEGYAWTEGPVWIEQGGYLLFSDIPNNRVLRYQPGVGTTTYLEDSGESNGLLLDQEGRLVLMQGGDRRVAAMAAPLESPASRYETLADQYKGKRLNSPNDAVYHSDGNLYFTDPPYGLPKGLLDEGRELSFQGIFRLDPSGQLATVDQDVSLPNGIGLSPDERTLYVAVSDKTYAVWLAYDVADDGTVSNKRVFYDATSRVGKADEPGLPDGLAVHSSGYIFGTGPGGVWLFSPDGEPLARILTGRAAANCALSADEKTLYVTATDTLMSVTLRKAVD